MARRRSTVWLVRQWRRSGANARLAIGALVVIAVWLTSLSPRTVLGVEIALPLALLCAAVGWGRVGLSVRPMAALIFLGLLYDVSTGAPLASFAVAALCTYGFQAAAGGAFDVENDPVLGRVLPLFSLAIGTALIWVIASSAIGHPTRVAPLAWMLLSTLVFYTLVSDIFNLRQRPGAAAGKL